MRSLAISAILLAVWALAGAAAADTTPCQLGEDIPVEFRAKAPRHPSACSTVIEFTCDAAGNRTSRFVAPGT